MEFEEFSLKSKVICIATLAREKEYYLEVKMRDDIQQVSNFKYLE